MKKSCQIELIFIKNADRITSCLLFFELMRFDFAL